MKYFAYGSNMDKQQMAKRCPKAEFLGKAVLPGYKLDFTISAPERWSGGGCADAVAQPGSKLWGLLYELSNKDIEQLDLAEGPRYRRIFLTVKAENIGSVKAYVYEVINKASFKEPSAQYLNIIKQAAETYGFPDSYRGYLAKIPTQLQS